MNEKPKTPEPPTFDPKDYPAHYTAIYMALHEQTCTIRAALHAIMQETGSRKRGVMFARWSPMLMEASAAFDNYCDTPPPAIARSYEGFLGQIASTETLRAQNGKLANHFRAIQANLVSVANALGLGKDANTEEVLAEIAKLKANQNEVTS